MTTYEVTDFKDLPEEIQKLEQKSLDDKLSVIKINGVKWILSENYSDYLKKLWKLKLREDDIWVVSFPRTGTTMLQEIVWIISNNFNYDGAESTSLQFRFPFIEQDAFRPPETIKSYVEEWKTKVKFDENSDLNTWLECIDSLPSPRYIKTHLSFSLLPNILDTSAKILYIARNPKDVVISLYNFYKNHNFIKYSGDINDFCNTFMKNSAIYCPYLDHVKIAWAERFKPNVLFMFYEDLIKDPAGSIRKICEFLNKTWNEEDISKLVNHVSFENFRKNPMVNIFSVTLEDKNMEPENFIRKGEAGGWKNVLSPQLVQKMDKWIEENLRDTDLVFPEDL